jgi:hypothetical protein
MSGSPQWGAQHVVGSPPRDIEVDRATSRWVDALRWVARGVWRGGDAASCPDEGRSVEETRVWPMCREAHHPQSIKPVFDVYAPAEAALSRW